MKLKAIFVVLISNCLGAATMLSIVAQDEQIGSGVVSPLATAKDDGNIDGKSDDKDMMRGLALTPRAFREAAEKIRPALVTIESFGGVSALQGKIGGIRKQGEGNTTGIVISPDGLVVTSSFNFIRQPPVITVVTSDGKRRIARLMGRDDTRQICLLRINDVKDLPVPEMVDPSTLQVGQWAITVGVGYGDVNPALSMGIISAKNRAGGRAIQTDANISPANYGGPLVDIEGRMIGVCVPLNPNSANKGAGVEWYDSGIGFAIPLHGKEDLILAMADGKSFYPAYLGVVVGPTQDSVGVVIETVDSVEARRKAAAARRNVPKPPDEEIPDQEEDEDEDKKEETEEDRMTYQYPALEAGLKKGDIILSINDKKIFDSRQLKIVISGFTAGDKIKLKYSRGKAKAKPDGKKEPEDGADSDAKDAAKADESIEQEKDAGKDEKPVEGKKSDKPAAIASASDADREIKEVEITLGRPPKMWLNEGIPPLNLDPRKKNGDQ